MDLHRHRCSRDRSKERHRERPLRRWRSPLPSPHRPGSRRYERRRRSRSPSSSRSPSRERGRRRTSRSPSLCRSSHRSRSFDRFSYSPFRSRSFERCNYSRFRSRSYDRWVTRRSRERQRRSLSRSWSPVNRHGYSRSRSYSVEKPYLSRSRSRSPSRRDDRRCRGSDSPPHKDYHRSENAAGKDPGKGNNSHKSLSALVSDFVDGIVMQQQSTGENGGQAEQLMEMEELLMNKLGIPVGFSSTKGKFVPDANVYAVKPTTKRQARQYMNRRGGFNRPLPSERNK